MRTVAHFRRRNKLLLVSHFHVHLTFLGSSCSSLERHDGGNCQFFGHKRKKRGLGRPARSMAKTSSTLQSVVYDRQKRQKQPSPLKWVKYRIFLSLSVRSLCILGVTVSFCNYSSQNFSPADVSAEVDQTFENRWGRGFW